MNCKKWSFVCTCITCLSFLSVNLVKLVFMSHTTSTVTNNVHSSHLYNWALDHERIRRKKHQTKFVKQSAISYSVDQQIRHSDNRTEKTRDVLNEKSKSGLSGTENLRFPYIWRKRHVSETDCLKLFQGDSNEIFQAKLLATMESDTDFLTDRFFRLTKRCQNFKRKRGYILNPLSEEERDFPIAYSILMYKDVAQFEKLFRAIYRPQNYYCIHVDKKSSHFTYVTVKGIADCFDNVFLLKNRTNVKWGEFSVLKPDIDCMRSLFSFKKWKYFINLTGQEFPLRTNHELVKILQIMDGANDIMSSLRTDEKRWKYAGDPPNGIRPLKGSVHITASRGFVEYAIYNQTAIDFLQWCKSTDIPDETFFPTLNHNPELGVPGSFKGDPFTPRKLRPFLTRFKQWTDEMYRWKCHGKKVRSICVLGIEDLQILWRRPEFFVNKFYNSFEKFALLCMEELYFNRTRDEYDGRSSFNTAYYEKLTQFKNIVH